MQAKATNHQVMTSLEDDIRVFLVWLKKNESLKSTTNGDVISLIKYTLPVSWLRTMYPNNMPNFYHLIVFYDKQGIL